MNIVQDSNNALKYSFELKNVRQEIDHYRPVQNPDSEERVYILKDHLYQFLSRLNPEYENLTSQLLNREHVPNFEESVSIIRHEESIK